MKAPTDLARPQIPPLRVGTTAWRVAAPGERLTHEFHLGLPCRPVHVGLIGAALHRVRIEVEVIEADCGICHPPLIGGPNLREMILSAEVVAFRESSVETTEDGRGVRVDYDLETVPGLRENLVVFVDFECTLQAKGQAS